MLFRSNYYSAVEENHRYLNITSFKKYDNWAPTPGNQFILLSQIVNDIRQKQEQNNEEPGFTIICFSCRYDVSLIPDSTTFRTYLKNITPNNINVVNFSKSAVRSYLASPYYSSRTQKNNIPKLESIAKEFYMKPSEFRKSGLFTIYKQYEQNVPDLVMNNKLRLTIWIAKIFNLNPIEIDKLDLYNLLNDFNMLKYY